MLLIAGFLMMVQMLLLAFILIHWIRCFLGKILQITFFFLLLPWILIWSGVRTMMMHITVFLPIMDHLQSIGTQHMLITALWCDWLLLKLTLHHHRLRCLFYWIIETLVIVSSAVLAVFHFIHGHLQYMSVTRLIPIGMRRVVSCRSQFILLIFVNKLADMILTANWRMTGRLCILVRLLSRKRIVRWAHEEITITWCILVILTAVHSVTMLWTIFVENLAIRETWIHRILIGEHIRRALKVRLT